MNQCGGWTLPAAALSSSTVLGNTIYGSMNLQASLLYAYLLNWQVEEGNHIAIPYFSL